MSDDAGGRPRGDSASERPDTNYWSIAAITLGILSVLMIPLIFGPPAAVCAGVAKWRRERLSTWAIWMAAIGLVGGTMLSVALYSGGTSS